MGFSLLRIRTASASVLRGSSGHCNLLPGPRRVDRASPRSLDGWSPGTAFMRVNVAVQDGYSMVMGPLGNLVTPGTALWMVLDGPIHGWAWLWMVSWEWLADGLRRFTFGGSVGWLTGCQLWMNYQMDYLMFTEALWMFIRCVYAWLQN